MSPRRVVAVAAPLLLLFASAPARAEPVATVAVLGVRAGEGFTDKEVATIEELLLGALQASGRLKVTGRSDVTVLLGLEAQKQAMGCDADAACVAEIAGALGVGFVISADVGRIGPTRIVTLKVLEVAKAASVARLRRTLAEDGDLVAAIDGVAGDAEGAIVRLLAERANASNPGLSTGKWAGIGTLAVAVALGAGAAALALGTRTDLADLQQHPRSGADAAARIVDINARADLSGVLGIAAGAVGAAGLVLVVAF